MKFPESLKNWILAASLACLTVATAQAEALKDAAHLQQEGKEAQGRGVPLLILYSAPNCAYCERVRKEFLLPMLRNPEYARKVSIRQIMVNGASPLRDFNGVASTHGAFARQQKIRLTPTIILYNAAGAPLSEPLIGLTTPDFYGAYLDRAIDESVAALKARKP